jgi:helicase required for RNAi-mediated heterochromatin assembly 1
MASGQDIAVATQIMQDHVLRPYENEFHPEAWRDLPEIPDKLEIMPQEDVCDNNDFFFEEEKWNAYQTELEHSANLPHNIIKGPWPSKEEYIAAHYQILREDAIASLRSSVKYFKRIPDMFDDRFIHIYTDVGSNISQRLSRANCLPGSLQGFTAWPIGTSFSY